MPRCGRTWPGWRARGPCGPAAAGPGRRRPDWAPNPAPRHPAGSPGAQTGRGAVMASVEPVGDRMRGGCAGARGTEARECYASGWDRGGPPEAGRTPGTAPRACRGNGGRECYPSAPGGARSPGRAGRRAAELRDRRAGPGRRRRGPDHPRPVSCWRPCGRPAGGCPRSWPCPAGRGRDRGGAELANKKQRRADRGRKRVYVATGLVAALLAYCRSTASRRAGTCSPRRRPPGGRSAACSSGGW